MEDKNEATQETLQLNSEKKFAENTCIADGAKRGESSAYFNSLDFPWEGCENERIQLGHDLRKELLRARWENQIEETHKLTSFKNPPVPLSRVKKIMRADSEVQMVANESPVLLAKACEMFIFEMTLRASSLTEASRRRTLTKRDIEQIMNSTEIYDFLSDIFKEKHKKDQKNSVFHWATQETHDQHPNATPARHHEHSSFALTRPLQQPEPTQNQPE